MLWEYGAMVGLVDGGGGGGIWVGYVDGFTQFFLLSFARSLDGGLLRYSGEIFVRWSDRFVLLR